MLAGAVPNQTTPQMFAVPCSCGDTCETCKGQKVRITVVPIRFVEPVIGTLEAYRWLRSHSILPCAGGYLDQANAFVEAVSIIDAVIAESKPKEVPRGRK